ncbi:hypothetical protein [Desulfosarcina sp.]|uniref:hypothetical protein n=1 Tax=Desulfosarcina sp. TaxID=2027861 RepID=UPI00356AA785
MINKKRTGHNHIFDGHEYAPVLSGMGEVPGWLIPQPINELYHVSASEEVRSVAQEPVAVILLAYPGESMVFEDSPFAMISRLTSVTPSQLSLNISSSEITLPSH